METVASADQQILLHYFEDLLYVLRRHERGLAERALARIGLSQDDVRRASPALSFDGYYTLLDWLYVERIIPVPGLQLGLRARAQDYGIFGEALLSSNSGGESLSLAQRYFATAWRHVRMEVFRDGNAVVSRFVTQPSALCHPVPLAQAVTAMCMAVLRELVPGFDARQIEARFAFRTPNDAGEYRAHLGCSVRFGGGWHELRQPADWLDRPVGGQGPKRPRAPLQALAAWQQWQRQGALADQVRRLLLEDCAESFPAAAEVAQRLGMAERTLRLHLATEGCSFRALVSEVRLELARRYLDRSGCSVGEVAARVGYGHTASFYRAFRQRYGHTPRDPERG